MIVMIKRSVSIYERTIDFWRKSYSWIIPCLAVVAKVYINHKYDFKITEICGNESFSDMLAAIITSMSIIISIFGFLIPSLISAKNDKMVKYFIENADMDEFIKKVKSVIRSGIIGILFSIILYVNENLLPFVRTILLYSWIAVDINFVCSSYRFISIIISLLLKEKKNINSNKCPNVISDERAELLKSRIQKF